MIFQLFKEYGDRSGISFLTVNISTKTIEPKICGFQYYVDIQITHDIQNCYEFIRDTAYQLKLDNPQLSDDDADEIVLKDIDSIQELRNQFMNNDRNVFKDYVDLTKFENLVNSEFKHLLIQIARKYGAFLKTHNDTNG